MPTSVWLISESRRNKKLNYYEEDIVISRYDAGNSRNGICRREDSLGGQ